jgi:dipeptidase E
MATRRLLLISNGSEIVGENATEAGRTRFATFLGESTKRLLFIPYASVIRSYEECADITRANFAPMGYEVELVHESSDPRAAVAMADAIVIPGGNTFRLLMLLHENNLMGTVCARVDAGIPYVGWSAGSNVACPTIRTTNDMPVIEPPGLSGLNLVPFQINPHYTDRSLDGHHGETRDERLAEFVHLNAGVHVVGLREGSMLQIEGSTVQLLGDSPARIFLKGRTPYDLGPDDSFDFLLQESNSE